MVTCFLKVPVRTFLIQRATLKSRFSKSEMVCPIIAENNTSFSVKFSARVFLSMSSEFTFGDNSDKFSIFFKKKNHEFG